MKKLLLLLVLYVIASGCSNDDLQETPEPNGRVNIRVKNLSNVFFEEVGVCSLRFVPVGRRNTTAYVTADGNDPICGVSGKINGQEYVWVIDYVSGATTENGYYTVEVSFIKGLFDYKIVQD